MLNRTSRFFPRALIATAGVVVLVASSFASADTLQIFADTTNSTQGIGDFTGSLTYDFIVGDLGVLTVDLTNTSDPGNGGWLTGLIFNIASGDPDVAAPYTGGTHPFEDAPGQNGAPYGNPFLGGAALGGNWLGGGFPGDGIAVGDSGSFSFDVFASDAGSLRALSFLEGPYQFNFLVRFRGFLDGNSEMVPTGPTVPAVPAPGALALLGFAALAQRRRRRSARHGP